MSTALQLIGLTAITIGAGLFSIPLGLIVGGVALVLLGLAVD
jgi:hypothetical protein